MTILTISHGSGGFNDEIGPTVVRVETSGTKARGLGSGVIIANDGLVLTNSHVVQGAKQMRLTLTDSRSVEADVLGDDPDTDLALLRADLPLGTPAARLGDSKALRRGYVVVAIGNPLGFESDGNGRRRLRARSVAAGQERASHR